jgi:hypothetical protein
VLLEASTKPRVHNLIHEFLIHMAFTMACPNFEKGLKMVFGPLGVKHWKGWIERIVPSLVWSPKFSRMVPIVAGLFCFPAPSLLKVVALLILKVWQYCFFEHLSALKPLFPQCKHKPPSKWRFFSCVVSGLYYTTSICISPVPECELKIVVEVASCE